jgi:hypothetical protein
MARLPVARVTGLIARQWTRWTDPHATAADLAATLGIRLPTAPTQITTSGGRVLVEPEQQQLAACT